MNSITLSVVVPAYNEAGSFPELLSRLSVVMKKLSLEYEIIIVDDGSDDDSEDFLRKESEKNKNLKVIFLSRNFGHQAALNAGLDYATGRAVVLMDADTQHPPEKIVEMFSAFQEGNEVILCQRVCNQQNNFFRDKAGRFFYFFLNKIGNLKLMPNVADFCLLSKNVINSIKKMPEHERFLRGIVQWVGFKKKIINYEAGYRLQGKSKYNLKRLVSLGLSGITSFSPLPLRISWWCGLVIFLLSMIYSCYVSILYLFFSAEFPRGWGTLIVVVLMLGGLQLMMIGILGEYLFKAFFEIKGRPLYIVRKKIGMSQSTSLVSHYGIDSTDENI